MLSIIALIVSAAVLFVAVVIKSSAEDGTIDELLPREISDKVYRIASYVALAALVSTVISVAMFLVATLIAVVMA